VFQVQWFNCTVIPNQIRDFNRSSTPIDLFWITIAGQNHLLLAPKSALKVWKNSPAFYLASEKLNIVN